MTDADNCPLETETVNEKALPADVSDLRDRVFESIRNGAGVPADIYDESGDLLLPAGSRITKQFLDLLRQRGITRVRFGHPSDGPLPQAAKPPERQPADDLQTKASRMLDERLAGELQRSVIYHPVKRWRRPRLSIDDLKSRAAEGAAKHEATSAAVADLCDSLDSGERISPTEIERSVKHFVDMAAVDFDLLPLVVALRASQDEYLYDHCVNVALLSVAMASQLGLDRGQIMEIGLGGMLHDIGMLRVPESIRLAGRPLTEDERHEIRRHPLHTLDMLSVLRGIPQSVKFIAYQAHERMDGQGYPRGQPGGQLHEYAKIVSISDVYAAMTRDRPYRPAMLPYLAAKAILTDGAADRFDRRLVRAFLDTISLFPIGSRVGLSTGRAARVLRANPGLHTRPVVEELSADGCPTGNIIDLSHENAPHVVKAT